MSPDPLAALSIRGIAKRFGSIVAVAGVSVDIKLGEICGLTGPNGSGKSTLFDCCTGLQKPSTGRVYAQGLDITGWDMHRIVREAHVIRSFQKAVVFQALSVEENLVLCGQMIAFPGMASTFGVGSASRHRVRRLREQAGHLLELVGLSHMRHATAGQISFGQQKLLQFASMLMPEPRVILLDEPMAGVNPILIDRMMENINRANREQGITFVVVEHNLDAMKALCHRLLVLSRGELIADGTPDTVVRDPAVVEAYLAG
jgi:ABC-type branched-subunit amino acid transport system ATPase component